MEQNEQQPVDLNAMTRDDLLAHAESLGLAGLKGNKAQIIAAITGKPSDEQVADSAPTAKFRVLRPLNHNHKTYPVGGIVRLTAEEAEPLLMHRVIEVATKEVPLT